MSNVLDSLKSYLSLGGETPQPAFNNDRESTKYQDVLKTSELDFDGQTPEKYTENAPEGARVASS